MAFSLTQLKISIGSEYIGNDPHLCILCEVNGERQARAVANAFKDKVGGFQVQILEHTHKIRVFCQLNKADDPAAEVGKRGNTVADAFIRIVHIARHQFPFSTVLPEAHQVLTQNAVLPNHPTFYRINDLKSYLPTGQPQNVEAMDRTFLGNLDQFQLTVEETQNLQTGAYIPINQALQQDDDKLRFSRTLPGIHEIDDVDETDESDDDDESSIDESESESDDEMLQNNLEDMKKGFFSFFIRAIKLFWKWLQKLVK